MNDFLNYKSCSKINLFLDITSKLKNGYHTINSLFCEISLLDDIDVKKNETGKLRYFDKKNILPEENLLKKAGDLFCSYLNEVPFGIDFYIDKNIPIGGGLGGGSSNAAAVLKILNNLWEADLSINKLKELAKSLGADVPFFIEGGIQKVNGIGDKSKSVKFRKKILDLNLLLVFPETPVMTKEAYSLIDNHKLYSGSKFYNKKFNNLISGVQDSNYNTIINNIYNVFEEVIFDKYPAIKKVYYHILNTNADKVFMTGSGSTLVGIYSDNIKLISAKVDLEKFGYKTKEVKIISNG
jgi:4-diphosphocytidyl-2-C-methyl-D-erythritol kinase